MNTTRANIRNMILGLSCLLFVTNESWGQTHIERPVPQTQAFQPVRIVLPEGASFAFSLGNDFLEPTPAPEMVGLNLGIAYRFRISDIPYHPGRALYPSVKILDRIHPPQGKELEFPIVVELTQEDLELALAGRLVTRIVYLENPQTASPQRSQDGAISTDIVPGADPLVVAKALGKPVAVVRIGARVPNEVQPDPAFFFGSPNWIDFSHGEGVVMGEQIETVTVGKK